MTGMDWSFEVLYISYSGVGTRRIIILSVRGQLYWME